MPVTPISSKQNGWKRRRYSPVANPMAIWATMPTTATSATARSVTGHSSTAAVNASANGQHSASLAVTRPVRNQSS